MNPTDEKYNWNLKDIFKSNEEFENTKNELNIYINKLKEFKGKLNNIDDVREYYKTKEKAYELHSKIACYASLNFHRNMGDMEATKIYKDIETIGANFGASISFAVPELI